MSIIGILGLLLFCIAGILAVILLALIIRHYYLLQKEAKENPPPGILVKVHNKNVHVFEAGQGALTLIFLSGHGTCCPTIDFKPLWKRLIPEYKIVVVERPGYGWSDSSTYSRDLDTVLEETRLALKHAKVGGPYVLVPHSMAGLEAIYWAQIYPREVLAIIGLDPTVPDFVEQSLEMPPKRTLALKRFALRIGAPRFMPPPEIEKALPLLKTHELSDIDKNQFLAMFFKSGVTVNMIREIDSLRDNAKMITRRDLPRNTPLYMFISDGSEVPGKEWKNLLVKFVTQFSRGTYKHLECGHFIHHEYPDLIADEMKHFISHTVRS